ncbi:kinesin-like protein KIN-14C [Arachis hypogaea]|uniref:kinesin-like protein KIN-14C n=1 Tax=Arachis hypogaea TaxID=3818 RepID=UPI0034E7CC09
MKPQSENHSTEPRNLGHSSSANFNGINFGEVEAKHRMLLVQWLNSLLPTLNLPVNITDDELRVCLNNGTILCQIMNKLRPGSVSEVSEFDNSPSAKSENVKRFLKAIDALGMPKFEISDLEKGHMKSVVDCLLTLRAKSLQNAWGDNISMTNSKVRSIMSSPSSHGGDQRKNPSESKFQSVLRSPVMAEPSAALLHHVGHKFHEVFQMKHGSYAELPAAKISELMKSTSLNNAPTQSLLSVVNAILEESVERRNSEIPHRVAVLLRKVVQEIERRISTQADHLKTQNNLFKAREEKYQSRIRVLEVLASGAREDNEVGVRSPIRQQQQTAVTSAIVQSKEQSEVTKMEEKKAFESIQSEKAKEETKTEDNQEVIRLMKELENKNTDISKLKQELEIMKKGSQDVTSSVKEMEDKNMEISALKKELETMKQGNQDLTKVVEEMENKRVEISTLKKELETMKQGNQDLTKVVEEMENKRVEFSALKQEVGTMKSDDQDVARLTKDLESKKIEIATMKQELEALRKGNQDVAGLMKDLENKSTEISTLKQEIETLKKGNQDVARLMNDLENKKAEISTKKQELENTMKNGNQDIARLMKDLENKSLEISALKQEIETLKKDNQDVARMMKDLENKSMEISTLKQEIETLKKDNQDVTRLMKDLENKNTEISTRKQELEDTLKNGNQDIAKLMTDLENKRTEISASKQEIETLKKDNQDVTKLVKDLENKNTELLTKKRELEETLKNGNQDIAKLTKDLENKTMEISALKQEIETLKKDNQDVTKQVNDLEKKNAELSTKKQELEEALKNSNQDIARLTKDLETTKKTYDLQCSQLEAEIKGAKGELKEKSQEYEHQLESLSNKIRENEASYESEYQKWNLKVIQFQKATTFQLSSIKVLKLSWETVKQHVLNEQPFYAEEFKRLGVNLKPLVDAAENYQVVLAENRKMFNDIQELKGNIRVYCRVRPFLPGQKEKQSIVEHYGETELVVANPSKQGKEALRTFKFNKVFGPSATQADVYNDIQAFIRSVLDGYNVCIFAYGQTGSGKTYTMSGPNGATAESVGVNYRALNDLFSIATTRQSTISYEIGVQVIEIYNEQVRDLLTTESTPKKVGILTHSQPNGLAVPDASMQLVKSTGDVIKLMDIGLKNRAKSATSMNERSSRSHSVVSINVRGVDMKSGSTLQGNLHLVDLAGSERVDRSEVTGDRLKEAQHINKSLSALGDVIFALAQKNAHVPYRNSKLTQLLQSSLGGHAKTLMLVQINSDVKSYSESLSTLKFAERVSGIELGAAKSTKDGKDVRELMEQVASLRDTILSKDEEIERLQLLKDLKSDKPTPE